MAIKKVLIISTGGTIAGQVADRDGATQGAEVFSEVLKPTFKCLKRDWGVDIEVDADEYCDVDSSDILPKHWMGLVNLIVKKYNDYDSFIITHGTNTMGYTCAALSFALGKLGKRVIITGSQVPNGEPGSDAMTNLENSVRVAAWPFDDIRGVISVFGSHIISGVRVKKSTEFDYDAFQTFQSGSLGRIGRIVLINKDKLDTHNSYYKPYAAVAKKLDVKNDFDISIISFSEFPGMSPDFFKTVVEHNNVKGIIFRAFGAGDASNHLDKAFRYLKEKGIPVIITTQAPSGNANMQVNEPGAKLMKEKLAIPVYDMSIESQTTKLAWLLGQGFSREEIMIKMLENIRGEVNVLEEPG